MSNSRPVCESLPRRLLMAAGDPDPTFSGDGRFTLDFPGSPFVINETVIQSSGKVVVVGTKAGNIAMARLNVNGTLDTSFGNDGLFESSRRSQVTSAAVQTDDKILVTFGATESFANMQVGRLLASGAGFDTGFGDQGIASISGSLINSTNAVTVQRDGKIVVAGSRDSGSTDFMIARYTAQGVADTTFDGDGLVVAAFGDDETALAVAVDYNGSPASNPFYGTIVAVGDKRSGNSNPSHHVTICRLLSDGSFDNSFDGDGKLTSPDLSPQPKEYANGLQIQSGGRIVIAGAAGFENASADDYLVARYLSNGVIDTSFGPYGTGIVQTNFGGGERPTEVATNFVGGFLVGGQQNSNSIVVAYTPDGLIDGRFGGGDGVLTTFGGGPSSLATSGDSIAPVRRLVLSAGSSVGRFVDVGSLVFIWEIDIEASEAGLDTARFEIARTEPLPTAERIYFDVSGSARGPWLLNADYLVQGATIQHPFQGPSYVDIPANEIFVTVTLTPRQDTLVEGDENAVFTLSPIETYDVLNTVPTTIAIRDDDDEGGPIVTSAKFEFETWPQRVEFTFSQDVSSSISDSDFAVTGPAGIPSHTFSYNSITNTATLGFNAILPNGNFSVRAIAAGITNGSGQPMADDYLFNSFFLRGDADHNGVINFDDYARIDNGFNNGFTGFSNGDFNYDGRVDFDDYSIIDLAFNSQ